MMTLSVIPSGKAKLTDTVTTSPTATGGLLLMLPSPESVESSEVER